MKVGPLVVLPLPRPGAGGETAFSVLFPLAALRRGGGPLPILVAVVGGLCLPLEVTRPQFQL